MSLSFDSKRTVRGQLPHISFEKIAQQILGVDYSLSLVLCGHFLAKRINNTYRKKTYSPNVLSFPLSKSEGEIFLNVRKAQQEARQFGVSHKERLAFLFIHACLHLRGLAHGKKMDELEISNMKKAGF